MNIYTRARLTPSEANALALKSAKRAHCVFQELIDIKMAQCVRVVNGTLLFIIQCVARARLNYSKWGEIGPTYVLTQ